MATLKQNWKTNVAQTSMRDPPLGAFESEGYRPRIAKIDDQVNRDGSFRSPLPMPLQNERANRLSNLFAQPKHRVEVNALWFIIKKGGWFEGDVWRSPIGSAAIREPPQVILRGRL